MTIITGGVSENVYLQQKQSAEKIVNGKGMGQTVTDSLRDVLKTAFFMDTLRTINWSRGYDWFAELDGVPSPFHRGGSVGLPLRQISFTITNGTYQSFETSSVETLQVPRTMGTLGVIALTLIDDEQQTLARFFERWYNQIYNPYKGVLPVTEACKQITIYKQKSTRQNLKRVYYNIDSTLKDSATSYLRSKVPRTTQGFDFLVFPYGDLQFAWGTDENDLNGLIVQLQVVHFVNQDFGNPLESTAAGGGLVNILGLGTNDWLNTVADYV